MTLYGPLTLHRHLNLRPATKGGNTKESPMAVIQREGSKQICIDMVKGSDLH